MIVVRPCFCPERLTQYLSKIMGIYRIIAAGGHSKIVTVTTIFTFFRIHLEVPWCGCPSMAKVCRSFLFLR